MVFLVFETVVLIAAAVACGIFLGIVAKQLFGKVIVVDGGRRHIGETIGVLVTSVLQTAAGRMIFAKPKAM